jgi:hypothetical protein
MTKRAVGWVVAAAFGLAVIGASADAGRAGAPPGTTARCVDGSYSFSQHHSGTCSHHGGVAVWFDRPTSTTTTAGSARPAAAPAGTGHTVLLARRTRTSGCKSGPNPDQRCSPGAYYSGLTKAAICSPGFHTRDIRNVSQALKFAVEKQYGMTPKLYGRTLEIDHIVSLELGGSNDIANLFPQGQYAHPGYGAKDRLENRLHDRVCSGAMTLRIVQRRIASNWQALYKRVFGLSP